jgi:sulfatase modifying factor 1
MMRRPPGGGQKFAGRLPPKGRLVERSHRDVHPGARADRWLAFARRGRSAPTLGRKVRELKSAWAIMSVLLCTSSAVGQGGNPKNSKPQAGTVRVDAKTGQEYVWICPGEFWMGMVPSDQYQGWRKNETPRHRVTITKGFWMGRTEVTVGMYQIFTRYTHRSMPSERVKYTQIKWSDKNYPMVDVSWEEARGYCTWAGGRLPTEAEWEYAARGGKEDLKYPWGNQLSLDHVRFWKPSPVESYPPNGFLLHEMAGNVWEWTSDWYDEEYYSHSPSVDPRGPLSGNCRAIRGGSWSGEGVWTSIRYYGNPANSPMVGFRCVLDNVYELGDSGKRIDLSGEQRNP